MANLPGSEQVARPRVRILLLEDEPSYASLVLHHLEGVACADAEVEVVETLGGALSRLVKPGIELVVADLNLPDSAGVATVEALAQVCQQPIIVVTAEEDARLHAEVMNAGAYELLQKGALSRATLERYVRLAVMQARALGSLKDSEARLRDMTSISSDWFWETDAEHRFLGTAGRVTALTGLTDEAYVGKRRWEVEGLAPMSGDWSEHRRILAGRERFRDFELVQVRADGERVYLEIAGMPVYDNNGAFAGYRGTASDITLRKTHERLLALEHSVTRLLSESRTVRGALLDVMEAICRSESWECGRFFRLDEQAGAMRMEHAWAGTEQMERFNRDAAGQALGRGAGLVGTVWETGDQLWVPDVDRHPRTANKALARRAGVHGAFLFPVAFEARIIGVMSFSSAMVRKPDQRMQQTMRVIGSQIGRFLRHKDDEAALRAKDVQLRLIMDSVPATLAHVSRTGRYLYTNRAHAEVYGHGGATGRTVMDVMGAEAFESVRHYRDRVLNGEPVTYELTSRDPSGRERTRSIHQVPELDEHGKVIGYYSLGTDITEHKRAEERVRYLAHHDALTGLPNRLLFQDRIGQAIAHAHRNRACVGVLFIDLDQFKHINDSLGHQLGDRLLQAAAERLKGCLREGDSVCRLGGDEFVICLPGLANGQDAAVVARKVMEAFTRPFELDGRDLHVGASVGISVSPADGDDAGALMRAADTAMYHAKEKGRGNYQFFTAALNDAAQQRLAMASKLRQALARGEFVLHYQPQVRLDSGRLFSVEALLRWQPPGGEPLPCADFISVAEETGLILPLGEWALREACAQARKWRSGPGPDLKIAVNLSARQFLQAGFKDVVEQVLAQTSLPPDALELEITESLLMLPSAENLATLQGLARLGVRLSMDDFGTGYSSLAYLQRFPLHALKIDRSFVSGIERDSSQTAIVTAIVAMAHSLGLQVVAEGVETAEQAAFLKGLRCGAAQGYYYGRPMSAAALEPLLEGAAHAPRYKNPPAPGGPDTGGIRAA